MLKYLGIFLVLTVTVQCQTINWGSRACLVNRDAFFTKIMQEVVTRIETEVSWCNLKINDVNRDINEALFKWQARGTANYTNGFLLSLRNIDINNIQFLISTRTVDGHQESVATLRGALNMRNVTIGYDVLTNFEGYGLRRYTGVFLYSLIVMQCAMNKNLNTNETTTDVYTLSSSGARRMEYMPDDSLSQVLSRDFTVGLVSGFNNWNSEYIAPFMLEAANKYNLPEIRYDYSC